MDNRCCILSKCPIFTYNKHNSQYFHLRCFWNETYSSLAYSKPSKCYFGNDRHLLSIYLLKLNFFKSLCYYANSSNGNGVLFMGDDHGQVTSLTFFQPKTELFRKKYSDKASVYYWLV